MNGVRLLAFACVGLPGITVMMARHAAARGPAGRPLAEQIAQDGRFPALGGLLGLLSLGTAGLLRRSSMNLK
jgi:MYXO-CTERM domain-containing protein